MSSNGGAANSSVKDHDLEIAVASSSGTVGNEMIAVEVRCPSPLQRGGNRMMLEWGAAADDVEVGGHG